MVETYAVCLPERVNWAQAGELLPLVAEERRQRVLRFRYAEDALRSLLGDLLTRHLLSLELGCHPADLSFATTAHGKPVLADRANPWFNVAHSGRWVAVAISQQPVGVDIEQKAPIDPTPMLELMSPDELKEFQGLPETTRMDYFYRLWTAKESFVKAVGSGLSVPLASITIRPGPGGTRLVCGGEALADFFLRSHNLDPEYDLSVCALEREFGERCNVVELDEIVAAARPRL